MRDENCVPFLQWALPRLGKRWRGFRKVRSQVCKRIARRLQTLGLRSLEAYRAFLDEHPNEWDWLDGACRITISRFYRNRRVFDVLFSQILPERATRSQEREDQTVHLWSAGCASGEEPYTLSIGWREALQSRFPETTLAITATDVQEHMLERARRGCYAAGTLKEMPETWVKAAFIKHENEDESFCLKTPYRTPIRWKHEDIRRTMPNGPFDGILCRNLVFMYFDETLRQACLRKMVMRLRPGGFLVLGKHDVLPPHDLPLEPWFASEKIYRRVTNER